MAVENVKKLDPSTILKRDNYVVMRMLDGEPAYSIGVHESYESAKNTAEKAMSNLNTRSYEVFEIDHEDKDEELRSLRAQVSQLNETLRLCRLDRDVAQDRVDELEEQIASKMSDAETELEKIKLMCRNLDYYVTQGIQDADDSGHDHTRETMRVLNAYFEGLKDALEVDFW